MTEPNIICQDCKEQGWIYLKGEDCIYNCLSKEHNSSGKVVKCTEKGEK